MKCKAQTIYHFWSAMAGRTTHKKCVKGKAMQTLVELRTGESWGFGGSWGATLLRPNVRQTSGWIQACRSWGAGRGSSLERSPLADQQKKPEIKWNRSQKSWRRFHTIIHQPVLEDIHSLYIRNGPFRLEYSLRYSTLDCSWWCLGKYILIWRGNFPRFVTLFFCFVSHFHEVIDTMYTIQFRVSQP